MIRNGATLWKNCLKITYGSLMLLSHPVLGLTSDDISTDLAKPTVNFENTLSSAIEQDGVINLTVLFSQELSGRLTYSVDGTVEQGVDFYVPELSIEVTSPVSEIDIAIELRDDKEVEDFETLRVTLQPSDNFDLGPARQHVVSIEDNDTNWRVVQEVDGMRFDYGMQIIRDGDNTDATMISYGGNNRPDNIYDVKLVRMDDGHFEAVVGPVEVDADRTLLGTEITRTFSLISAPSAVREHEIDYERLLVGDVTETWYAPKGGAYYFRGDLPKISGDFAMFRVFDEIDLSGVVGAPAISEHPKGFSECNDDRIAVASDDVRVSVQEYISYDKRNVENIIKRAEALLYLDDNAPREINDVAAFRYEELLNDSQATGDFKDYWTCNEKLRAHDAAQLLIEALKLDPWNQEARRTLLDIYYGIAKADKISALQKHIAVAELRITSPPTENTPIINKEIYALEEVLFLYHNAFTSYMKGMQTVFDFDAVEYIQPLIRQAIAEGAREEAPALLIASEEVKQQFRQALSELAYEELAVPISPGNIKPFIRQELASSHSSRCGNPDLATLGTPHPKLVSAQVHTLASQALAKLAREESDLRIAPGDIEPLVRQALEGLAREKSAVNDIVSREKDYGKILAREESDLRIAPGDIEPLVRQELEEFAREGLAMPIASAAVKQSVLDALTVILDKSSFGPCPANSLSLADGTKDAFAELVADARDELVADTLTDLVAGALVGLYADALADNDIDAFAKIAAGTLDELLVDALERLAADALDELFAEAVDVSFAAMLGDDDANAFTEAFLVTINYNDNAFFETFAGLIVNEFDEIAVSTLDGLVDEVLATPFASFLTDGDLDEFAKLFGTEFAEFAELDPNSLAALLAAKLEDGNADPFVAVVSNAFSGYVSKTLAKDAFLFDRSERRFDQTHSNGFARHKDIALLLDLLRDYLRTAEELTTLYIARGDTADLEEAYSLFNSALQSAYLGGHALLVMFPEIKLLDGADYVHLKEAAAGWRLSYSTLANIRGTLNGDVNILGYPDEILVLLQSTILGDDQSYHSFSFFKNRLMNTGPTNPLSQAEDDQTEAQTLIDNYGNYNDRRQVEKFNAEEIYYKRLAQIVGVWPFESGYDDPLNNHGEIAWQAQEIETARYDLEKSNDDIHKLEENIHLIIEQRSTAADIYSAMSNIYIEYGEKQVSLTEEINEIGRRQASWERNTAAAERAMDGIASFFSLDLAGAARGIAGLLGAGARMINASNQDDMEREKNSLEESKERLAALQQGEITANQGALNDAEFLRSIKSSLLEVKGLELASARAAIRIQQAMSKLSALYYEKENLERRKNENDAMLENLYFADPSHRLRKDAALLRSESSFANAQRWLFLTLRAAEYKWNMEFKDRGALFKARNYEELKDFLILLISWDDNINFGQRNDDGEKIFSIRKDLLDLSQDEFHRYIENDANYVAADSPENPIPGFKVIRFNFSTAKVPRDGGLFMANSWNEKIISLGVRLLGGSLGDNDNFANGYLTYGGVGLVRNRVRGTPSPDDPGRLVNEITVYPMQRWIYLDNRWQSAGKFGARVGLQISDPKNLESSIKEINVFKEFSVATTEWNLFVAVENGEGVPLVDVDCSSNEPTGCLDDIQFRIKYYWYSRVMN